MPVKKFHPGGKVNSRFSILNCLVLSGLAISGCKSSSGPGENSDMMTKKVADLVSPESHPAENSGAINVSSFGVVGNGTDESQNIQLAIDAAIKKGGGVVLFPPGTYTVGSLCVAPGLTLLGYGATLKKIGGASKFSRLIETAPENCPAHDAITYGYSGDSDSRQLIIKGFEFDGSRQRQSSYTGFELEQQHMIFIMGNPSKSGRLRALIEDCQFHDGVADAVSVYVNSSVSVQNCSATDVFRGGVVVTGGFTDVIVNNFRASGKTHLTGIHVEVDTPGYGGKLGINMSVNNAILDGDFHLELSAGSVFLGNNIQSLGAPFLLRGDEGTTVRISNSYFAVGVLDGAANRIVRPGDTSFDHTVFKVTASPAAAAHVYWNVSSSVKNQTLRFHDCTFKLDPSVATQGTSAVFVEPNDSSQNNRLIIDDSRIESGFNSGVILSQGGAATIRNTFFNSKVGISIGAGAQFAADSVILDNLTFGDLVTQSEFIQTYAPISSIEHRNFSIDEHFNTLGSQYGLKGNNYSGHRRILGINPPLGTTPCLLGDEFELKRPLSGFPFRWICTATGLGTSSFESTTWVVESNL